MADYIEREALKAVFEEDGHLSAYVEEMIDSIPAADVRPVVKAKWEDVHIDRPEIADLEVASMFCPNCNRWHNEVYHYGNPIEFANYCQFCGADMREADDEKA